VLGAADPRRVTLAGDSAGGSLTVSTLCALRDAGDPLPAAAALICPWTEPLAAGGSMDAHAPFDFGDRALLAGWAQATLGAGDPDDPRFTVANATLDRLPPLLVQIGSVELLYDQALRFDEQARKAGVDTTLEVLPEMFHPRRAPPGRAAAGGRRGAHGGGAVPARAELSAAA
jgi:acetyl esterase/lipase